jgi:hypothetical protein
MKMAIQIYLSCYLVRMKTANILAYVLRVSGSQEG